MVKWVMGIDHFYSCEDFHWYLHLPGGAVRVIIEHSDLEKKVLKL